MQVRAPRTNASESNVLVVTVDGNAQPSGINTHNIPSPRGGTTGDDKQVGLSQRIEESDWDFGTVGEEGEEDESESSEGYEEFDDDEYESEEDKDVSELLGDEIEKIDKHVIQSE